MMKKVGLSLRAQRSNLLNILHEIASSLALFSMTMLFPVSCAYANSAIQTIQSAYASITDLQADFIQSTYVAVLDKTIKEPGIFSMKKPGMLRIEYTGEHPKQYISDGKRLWIIDSELEQVETYKVSKDSVPKEGLELLKGFSDMEKLFSVEPFKPKKIKSGFAYLKLTPKSKNLQYNSLDCVFGADNLLKEMTIHNKSGNISTYVFNNIRVNVGLDNNLFILK
ncbi:MAG: outer membrane lipoprotein carrier protein LolA [Deltaproteobacteria bacterium]|nr:outer membrane lipoprotein carrier protein LolA [Deltaproteobacteria bacterium]